VPRGELALSVRKALKHVLIPPGDGHRPAGLAFLQPQALFALLLAAEGHPALAGSGNAAVMLIKYVFYLLNSINGLRIWLSLSKRRSL